MHRYFNGLFNGKEKRYSFSAVERNTILDEICMKGLPFCQKIYQYHIRSYKSQLLDLRAEPPRINFVEYLSTGGRDEKT